MKTRAEIYGNEAAALLRIVTMYPGLNMQQLLCFHPGKEEIIKTLLSHLQKQGRIFKLIQAVTFRLVGQQIGQLPDTGCLGTLGFYRAGGIPCSR